MGEAKERDKAGKSEVKKMYAESDYCPACGKTLSSMDKEHGGKLVTLMSGTLVVCWRCGNVFFPKSRLPYIAEAASKTIIDPSSSVGQATQQAASKIFLPGGNKP